MKSTKRVAKIWSLKQGSKSKIRQNKWVKTSSKPYIILTNSLGTLVNKVKKKKKFIENNKFVR